MGMSNEEEQGLISQPTQSPDGDYSDGAGERRMQEDLKRIEAEKQARRERNYAEDPEWEDNIASAEETERNQRKYNYVNPGAANYGGDGGVEYYKEQGRLGGMKNDAQQAQNAAAMAQSSANMKANRGIQGENAGLAQKAMNTRDMQIDALELSRQAASGEAPSEAEGQVRLGMNDAMATQSGAMGGARGLSALGGTQSMGSSHVGNSAGNLAMQGGLARSKEITDAIGMYGTQAGSLRDQDQARLQQNSQNSQFGAKLNNDWKMGNAGLLAQQAGLSNTQTGTDLAWKGEEWRGTDKQFQYHQEMAAKEAGADADAVGARLAKNREDKENKRQAVGGAFQGGMTFGGAMIGGPAGGAIGGMGGAMVNNAVKDWEW